MFVKHTAALIALVTSLALFAPVAAQERMPTRDEKAGIAYTFNNTPRSGDPLSSPAEYTRYIGLFVNYINAPFGSPEERRAWTGLQEYMRVRNEREAAINTRMAEEYRVQSEDRRQADAERATRNATAIEEYNRLCRVYRSRPSWSLDQLRSTLAQLRNQRFSTEPAPYPEGYVDPIPDRCHGSVEDDIQRLEWR